MSIFSYVHPKTHKLNFSRMAECWCLYHSPYYAPRKILFWIIAAQFVYIKYCNCNVLDVAGFLCGSRSLILVPDSARRRRWRRSVDDGDDVRRNDDDPRRHFVSWRWGPRFEKFSSPNEKVAHALKVCSLSTSTTDLAWRNSWEVIVFHLLSFKIHWKKIRIRTGLVFVRQESDFALTKWFF